MKIVSGGQTGVDRAALDVAQELGMAAGGWAPAGRLAEDGRIPDRYPVRAMPEAGYADRTRQNVIDSDGTLIVSCGERTGGTALTVDCCEREGKPLLCVRGDRTALGDAAQALRRFVLTHNITVLNVAGPRASQDKAAPAYTEQLLRMLLNRGSDV
ncbi:MAG: putative molybdenum carrier protein [Pseudomonadota bacterium]